jgi:hypothetical protein
MTSALVLKLLWFSLDTPSEYERADSTVEYEYTAVTVFCIPSCSSALLLLFLRYIFSELK